MRMLGVADPDGTIRFGVMAEESEPLISGKVLRHWSSNHDWNNHDVHC